MYMLYSLLIILILIACALLAIPFIKKQGSIINFTILALFLVIFTFTLYQFSGNKSALYAWLGKGQQHYQLQEAFEKLGGVEGAINSIENKLKTNPADAKGWLILGKLYLAKNDLIKAKNAFNQARELKPNDIQINRFYEMSLGQSNEK